MIAVIYSGRTEVLILCCVYQWDQRERFEPAPAYSHINALL